MTISRPEREKQALREAGRTDVSRVVGALLVGLFLVTVAIVPLLEPLLADPSGVFEVALDILPEAARTGRQDGLLAANRQLLAGINRFEDALEEQSFLRELILPPTQSVLTSWLGVGNEQAVLGHEGWLFFRDDFEHVTGRGFLEPRMLKKTRLESTRAADPLPAILGLHRDLAARGIDLVVMPTPVKPTVHPEFLAPRANGGRAIHNPSFGVFTARLEAAGVTVFDPTGVLAAAKARPETPLYLRTDTHWTSEAVALVARELAAVLDARIDWQQQPGEPLVRRAVSVAGIGDTKRMLLHRGGMRDFQPDPSGHGGNGTVGTWSIETTEVFRVMTRRGRPWRPDREAEVLLLGDSFTNIYSDAALGWGTGAGLAEQLHFELGRPIDRIALNAGGAWSSRQALARGVDTESGGDRLAGKRVVVYQFATRELSQGDWKVIDLTVAAPGSL